MLLRLVVNQKQQEWGRRITGIGRRWITTAVMSFGDGYQGAAGPTGGGDNYEPTPVTGLPRDVSFVGAGHYHSLAVTSNGDVWSWGRDVDAQLGRGIPSPRDSWSEPKKVEGLDQVRVKSAYGSGVMSAAIGDDGSLWVWGKSRRGQLGLGKGVIEAISPMRVEALADEKIVKVALGWGHALAQTEDGRLYGWGYSADGRLGNMGKSFESSPLESNGNKLKPMELSDSITEAAEKLVLEKMEKEKDMPIVWEPSLVEKLSITEVVDVACGLDHSLILCRDSTLLSCGSNTYGQLGRENDVFGMSPVDTLYRPLSISCGLGHSLAVCQIEGSKDIVETTTGIVSWGWNMSSQLGREGPSNIPGCIKELNAENPISVCGGRVHSMALTSKKELWVWGSGRNGRLGLGCSVDEDEPKLVEYLEGQEVLQAVSGFDHNLVLVAQ